MVVPNSTSPFNNEGDMKRTDAFTPIHDVYTMCISHTHLTSHISILHTYIALSSNEKEMEAMFSLLDDAIYDNLRVCHYFPFIFLTENVLFLTYSG